MVARATRAQCIGLALVVCACTERAAPDPAQASVEPAPTEADAPTKPAAPEGPPAIVDMCTFGDADEDGQRVCVLLDDGRVSCGPIQVSPLAPPLAGIDEAVELGCNRAMMCARGAQGEVTCLDAAGELRVLSLAKVRALELDDGRATAVTEDGAVVTWTGDLAPKFQDLGPVAAGLGLASPGELDVRRAIDMGWSYTYGLRGNGDLVRWETSEDPRLAHPTVIETFAAASEVTDLGRGEYESICWRRGGPWECERDPLFQLVCDHATCTCTFANDHCDPREVFVSRAEPSQLIEATMWSGPCVVDAKGQLWCQGWPEHPAEPRALTLEGRSTRVPPFDGELADLAGPAFERLPE